MGVQIDQAREHHTIRRVDLSMGIKGVHVAHRDDASVANGYAGSLVD
jgi:hypothetical protein